MTVDDWVREALEHAGTRGATVRDVQRWIDEHRNEELAVDTIEASLEKLLRQERAETVAEGRYAALRKTGTEDALKRLFGE